MLKLLPHSFFIARQKPKLNKIPQNKPRNTVLFRNTARSVGKNTSCVKTDPACFSKIILTQCFKTFKLVYKFFS